MVSDFFLTAKVFLDTLHEALFPSPGDVLPLPEAEVDPLDSANRR